MSYETFDPVTWGYRPQRNYTIRPEWAVAQDERELGNVHSTLIAQKPKRCWSMTYLTDTRDAYEYLMSFQYSIGGPAGRFYWQAPEYVAMPHKAPTLTAVSGGTQAERSITLCFAWKNSAGRTKASPAGTLVVPANYLIHVALPIYPPSITQAVLYAAEDDPGNEQEQTTITNQRAWTQPDAALLLSTAPVPSANTALETPLCRFRDVGEPKRGVGTQYSVTVEIEEAYT